MRAKEVRAVATFRVPQIRISAVSTAVPANVVPLDDYRISLGDSRVDRFVEYTGIKELRATPESQTALDLSVAAVTQMLNHHPHALGTLGALVYVTQTPDYRRPGNGYLLHHALNLPADVPVFDLNHACSGYINGLVVAAGLLGTSDIDSVLVVAAETSSKLAHPGDPSVAMLFGDAGSATLVQRDEAAEGLHAVMRADGSGFSSLAAPGGGARGLFIENKPRQWSDGGTRGVHNVFMDGLEVMRFVHREMPGLLIEFSEATGHRSLDFDWWVFHQANKKVVEMIAQDAGISPEKVLTSFGIYGNTSSASIPLTLAANSSRLTSDDRIAMAGFGTGWSWGAVTIPIDMSGIYPPVESSLELDEFSLQAFVNHWEDH